jgi:hypothetical protein
LVRVATNTFTPPQSTDTIHIIRTAHNNDHPQHQPPTTAAPLEQCCLLMADCKPVVISRKRRAEPLAEQQSQLLTNAGQCGALLSVTAPTLLSDALAYARHFPPPAKRLLPAHSSASSSCGSLLDDNSSRGEFSTNGDANCLELDFGSDAASRRRQRHETSLGQLTKKFVALLDQATDGVSITRTHTHTHTHS